MVAAPAGLAATPIVSAATPARTPSRQPSRLGHHPAATLQHHSSDSAELGAAVDGLAEAAASSDNIRVVLRVRPRSERESSLGGATCIQPLSSTALRVASHPEPHNFSFDYVAGDATDQDTMFRGGCARGRAQDVVWCGTAVGIPLASCQHHLIPLTPTHTVCCCCSRGAAHRGQLPGRLQRLHLCVRPDRQRQGVHALLACRAAGVAVAVSSSWCLTRHAVVP